ncbi:MAG: YbaB/EbfC family nucleoid-associated protein [Spirochaetales bacterium]|nr:YbaB/EbfC family nucleoid-associated protein [Spirochaetales bacterium]
MTPFDLLKNFNINSLREKADEIRNKMEACEITGEAGGGFVKVKINGKFKIIDIDYENNKYITEDLETFKNLIICAQNDACEKMTEKMKNEFGSSFGDISSILGR